MALPEDTSGVLGQALGQALENPLEGPPRRPNRVRVADAVLAPEIQEVLGDHIPIEVAPTPELDDVLQAMLAAFPRDEDDASYLADGKIPPTAIESLFLAASVLFTVKPWKYAGDSQVLRMDIPSLGIEGACISIIGALGESLGVLIFPSLEGFEAFLHAADRMKEASAPIDAGTGWLALEFERGANLPDSMRREVAEHGWEVAGPEAYPVVQHRDRDCVPRPLTIRDVELATACALSLSSFLVQHEQVFASDAPEPVSVSYFDDHDREVRLTAPYEAFQDFESGPAPTGHRAPSRPRISRNAPCPCGSGRKYKKCHLPLDEAEQNQEAGVSRLHDLDTRVVRALSRFAARHYPDAWAGLEKDFKNIDETLALVVPWSVYVFRVDGRSVAEAYIEERGRRCTGEERGWLVAQQAAWLSVWEVIEVDVGSTVTLRDLLSGETRCVIDVSASQTAAPGLALLARVVDYEGISLLCGSHPQPLLPTATAEVVRRARGRLRRKRAVPVERLRDEAFGRYLIRRWEEMVEEVEAQSAFPPVLQNTDGDPFLATTDHFKIAPGTRPNIAAQLAAMESVVTGDAGRGSTGYNFLRPGDSKAGSPGSVLIGHARLSRKALEIETNSMERADELRDRIEAACGDWIHHRGRVHADPLSSQADPAPPDATGPALSSPEMDQILLQYKQRHYADWVDHPLPALAGKTPRDAVRTPKGRTSVDVLIKEMEYMEQQAGGAAFDFSGIRRELGFH